MQGFERADRQLLDAAALAGHLVPAGSMFAFLAAHRAEVFPDADYADLFCPPGVGRPSLPATPMAAVLTLQVLHDYSDRETAEAVKFDVRWKVAIGASLDDPGFDPQDTVTQLVSAIRRVAREVPGAAEQIAAVCTGHDYSKPGKPKIDWDAGHSRLGAVHRGLSSAPLR